jgi:hypothetical protein
MPAPEVQPGPWAEHYDLLLETPLKLYMGADANAKNTHNILEMLLFFDSIIIYVSIKFHIVV